MVKRTIVLPFFFAVAACISASYAGPVGVVPGRILLKPGAGAPGRAIEDAIRPFGGEAGNELPGIGVIVVTVPEKAWAQALEGLKRNPNIEFAEPDVIHEPDATVNDPYFSQAWHLTKIQAPTAWNTTFGSSSVTVAILDTGVDGTHPDLKANLVPGWNTYSGNSDTSDVHGHGTAVAGTVAATMNNGVGVAGIAGKCRLMPMRISDAEGYGYDSAMANALTWAADRGARVANISYEVSTSSTVKSAAQYFQNKGGVVTVAAGNYSSFETATENPYVLTVSATDQYDRVTSFSNTGNLIDLAAPGVSVMTTLKGGGYGGKSGTSFSAPVVAGVAALVISVRPDLTGAQIAQLVKSTSDDLGSVGWDTTFGAGRVNAYKAVQSASPTTTPSDTTAPQVVITSPTSGQTVSSPVNITVNATDNVSVTRADLYVNGVLVASSTTAPFTTTWNNPSAAPGQYSLQVKARDAAGNVGQSAMTLVTIASPTEADTQNPIVTITSPSAGQTLTIGLTVPVNVDVQDNSEIRRVNLSVNGVYYHYSVTPPFTILWKPTSSGLFSLSAKAIDAAGNVGASQTVTVSAGIPAVDSQAPTVSIISPVNGATISGQVSIKVNVADNTGVTRADLYVNNTLVNYSSAAPFTTTWDSSSAAPGEYLLQVKARDAAGNTGTSQVISVSVPSPVLTERPNVQIVSPIEGQVVSGLIPVHVSASDTLGIWRVNLSIDGTYYHYSSAPPFTIWVNASSLSPGTHSLKVKAIGSGGNVWASEEVNISTTTE